MKINQMTEETMLKNSENIDNLSKYSGSRKDYHNENGRDQSQKKKRSYKRYAEEIKDEAKPKRRL